MNANEAPVVGNTTGGLVQPEDGDGFGAEQKMIAPAENQMRIQMLRFGGREFWRRAVAGFRSIRTDYSVVLNFSETQSA